MNVTKIAAGAASCNRNEPAAPDCLRLTGNLATVEAAAVGPWLPYDHGFEGKTLHYYADQTSDADSEFFVGAYYVWQPGWPAAKRLAPAVGLCFAQADGSYFQCVQNFAAAGDQIDADLLAGRAADGLTKIARLHLFDNGVAQHAFEFTDSGAHLLFSGVEASEPETLWVVKTEELADRKKYVRLGSGLSDWKMGDDRNIFYLKDYNRDSTRPSGRLMMNDLQAGGREVELARNVGDFRLHKNSEGVVRTVSFRDNVQGDVGTLKLIHDVELPATAPGNLETRAPQVAANYKMSPDLRLTFFSKRLDEGVMDAHLVKQGGSPCVLQQGVKVADWDKDPFAGQVVLWAESYDPNTETAQGFQASVETCRPQRFSASLSDYNVLGDGRLRFDERAPNQAFLTLRYGKVEGATFPTAPLTLVRDAKPGTTATVAGGEGLLVGKATDGGSVYFVPLPR